MHPECRPISPEFSHGIDLTVLTGSCSVFSLVDGFRYREAPMTKDGLSMFISQSGETADTLAGLKYCEDNGQKQIGRAHV